MLYVLLIQVIFNSIPIMYYICTYSLLEFDHSVDIISTITCLYTYILYLYSGQVVGSAVTRDGYGKGGRGYVLIGNEPLQHNVVKLYKETQCSPLFRRGFPSALFIFCCCSNETFISQSSQ